jgi:hypothetical protein
MAVAIVLVVVLLLVLVAFAVRRGAAVEQWRVALAGG